MLVLGIESSCDETAAAVIDGGNQIKANVIASQVKIHAPFGGVVPELASREHLNRITQVVDQALSDAGLLLSSIDGIAVTQGPGLVGALLVGLSYAKSLAFSLNKPIVGINHIEGHVFSVVFENPPIEYPAIALIVSGGHTTLFLIPAPEQYAILGRTRDDAAGEAYDKIAKLLGLGYPGGPVLDKLAQAGDPDAARMVFTIPRMSGNLDFSFSGLKTAVVRFVKENGIEPVQPGESAGADIVNLAASFQEQVIKSLVGRLKDAVARHLPKTVILAGGVACNSGLRRAVTEAGFNAPVYFPSPLLTTDNAAMIAAAGYPKLLRGENHGFTIKAMASMNLANFALEGYELTRKGPYRHQD